MEFLIMIHAIVVGSGNGRTVVEPTRDRNVRRVLANKIKGFLFPNSAAYHKANRVGERRRAALNQGAMA